MVRLVKDVLRPGRYRVKDAGGPRIVEVTPHEPQHWASQFGEMQAAGIGVPILWEHPPAGSPESVPADPSQFSDRDKSKYTAGWVKRLYVDADGALKFDGEYRKEDGGRLEEIGGYVSPAFGGQWTDSTGRTWNNPIRHIALTYKPVAWNQSKTFTRVDPVSAFSEPVCLSLADLTEEPTMPQPTLDATDRAKAEGLFRQAWKLVFGKSAQFSDDDPPSEEDEPDDKPDAPEPPAVPDPGADKEAVQQLRAALSTVGVVLPESISLSGDLNVLIAAVMSSQATKKLEATEARQEPQAPRQEEPATVTMSEQERQQFTQLSEQNEKLLRFATKAKRDDYARRIENLEKTGRCKPDDATRWKAGIEQYQFSEGGDGQSRLDLELDIHEKLPAGAYWTDDEKIERFSLEEDRPSDGFLSGGDPSDEEADALVDQMHGKAR